MITILRIKALEKQNIKTKKSQKTSKSTSIKEMIRLSYRSNFNLIQNASCFLVIFLLEILRCCSDSSPQIRFGSNHKRVVSSDRALGH
jgi:hypothetical protein